MAGAWTCSGQCWFLLGPEGGVPGVDFRTSYKVCVEAQQQCLQSARPRLGTGEPVCSGAWGLQVSLGGPGHSHHTPCQAGSPEESRSLHIWLVNGSWPASLLSVPKEQLSPSSDILQAREPRVTVGHQKADPCLEGSRESWPVLLSATGGTWLFLEGGLACTDGPLEVNKWSLMGQKNGLSRVRYLALKVCYLLRNNSFPLHSGRIHCSRHHLHVCNLDTFVRLTRSSGGPICAGPRCMALTRHIQKVQV